jgi:hypothetical protein
MLLRTSVAAFAAAISLGLWSEASNTVLAHDIYSNLRDRDGHLCCGGEDCKPVEAIGLPNGNYYLPKTGETIPADMAHHQTSVSTIVSIIQWQLSLTARDQYGKANLRPDASLLR